MKKVCVIGIIFGVFVIQGSGYEESKDSAHEKACQDTGLLYTALCARILRRVDAGSTSDLFDEFQEQDQLEHRYDLCADSSAQSNNTQDTKCLICFEEFDTMTLPQEITKESGLPVVFIHQDELSRNVNMRHWFHDGCLYYWISRIGRGQMTCPICRGVYDFNWIDELIAKRDFFVKQCCQFFDRYLHSSAHNSNFGLLVDFIAAQHGAWRQILLHTLNNKITRGVTYLQYLLQYGQAGKALKLFNCWFSESFDAVTQQGDTVLHLMLAHGELCTLNEKLMLKKLIESCSLETCMRKDKKGRTALDYAIALSNLEVIAWLRNAGVKQSAVTCINPMQRLIDGFVTSCQGKYYQRKIGEAWEHTSQHDTTIETVLGQDKHDWHDKKKFCRKFWSSTTCLSHEENDDSDYSQKDQDKIFAYLAVQWAVKNSKQDLLEKLFTCVDNTIALCPDDFDNSLLIVAVHNNNYAGVKSLLAHGACNEVYQENSQGESAYTLALKRRNKKMQNILTGHDDSEKKQKNFLASLCCCI